MDTGSLPDISYGDLKARRDTIKDSFYFKHDLHARADEKIIGLLQKQGWEGYGIYWGLVEKIYENDGALLKDYERIAYDMRTQCERIKSVCEDFDLFYVSDTNEIRSHSIDRRIEERKDKQSKAISSAKTGWAKRRIMPSQCERIADAMPPHEERNAKEKEKEKEKEIRKIIHTGQPLPQAASHKSFIKPTIDEVRSFITANKYPVDPDKWINHYESNGWKVGKNSMKNWHAAVRTWAKSSIENFITPEKNANVPACNKVYVAPEAPQDHMTKEQMDALSGFGKFGIKSMPTGDK